MHSELLQVVQHSGGQVCALPRALGPRQQQPWPVRGGLLVGRTETNKKRRSSSIHLYIYRDTTLDSEFRKSC